MTVKELILKLIEDRIEIFDTDIETVLNRIENNNHINFRFYDINTNQIQQYVVWLSDYDSSIEDYIQTFQTFHQPPLHNYIMNYLREDKINEFLC